MKRLSPRDKLVLHGPLLLVRQQGAVLQRDLLAQPIETALHQIGGSFRVKVMDRQFEQFASQEAPLDRSRLAVRQKTLARRDAQFAQCRLVAGQLNRHIEMVVGRPGDEFFRRVAPAQAKGRLQNSLRGEAATSSPKSEEQQDQSTNELVHGANVGKFRCYRKARSRRRCGFVVVEAVMALTMLTAIGLMLLKLSLNVLVPRQWVVQQTITDAYLTGERAFAERVPFETLVGDNSPFPIAPVTVSVEIGRLPYGVPVTGQLIRSRSPDLLNYQADGGEGTLATNPAGTVTWRAQSVIVYQIGGRNYAKSRTVLRSQ